MRPSKMTNEELVAAISRGAEVKLFMESNPVFRSIILPALDAADKETERDGDWKPGKSVDPVEIALFNSYNSGKKDARRFIVSALEREIKDGLEAAKALEQRNKAEGKTNAV